MQGQHQQPQISQTLWRVLASLTWKGNKRTLAAKREEHSSSRNELQGWDESGTEPKMELTKALNCKLRKSDKRELAWTRRTLTWNNEISWLDVTVEAETLAEGGWRLRLKVH